jgi:hypothetical protein
MTYVYEIPSRPPHLVLTTFEAQPSLTLPVEAALYADLRRLALHDEAVLLAWMQMALREMAQTLAQRTWREGTPSACEEDSLASRERASATTDEDLPF